MNAPFLEVPLELSLIQNIHIGPGLLFIFVKILYANFYLRIRLALTSSQWISEYTLVVVVV